MKNLKGKILIGIVAIVVAFIAVISSFAFFKNGINFMNDNNNAPYELNANSTQYNLSSKDIIKKGTELLGVPYQFGKKGVYYYNVYDGNNSLNSSNLYNSSVMFENRSQTYQERQPNGSVLTKYTYGIDCSGLVYYTLTALNCKTKGYNYQNPVPVDTAHWLTTNGTIQRGNNEKKVNVLKQNEKITSQIRYYNRNDGTEIPSGSIIISDVVENGVRQEAKSHAWIYLGNFQNVNELKNWLVNAAGVPASYLERTNLNGQSVIYDDGKGGTHWRLEAAGSVGVRISNVDPDDGSADSGKVIGRIWAFQVSDDIEVTGQYKFTIQKVDTKGNAIEGSSFKVQKEEDTLKDIEMEAVNGRLGRVSTKNPIAISSISKSDVYYIEEITAPNGYEKFQDKIKLEVTKIISGNKYLIHKVKVYSLNSNNEWEEQARTNDEYQYFNGKVKVDWDAANGNIGVTIKNEKIDLALKKTITKVTNQEGETKDVTKENNFNVSRSFSESGYTDLANNNANIGINTSKLANGEETNATYWMNKTPVEVEVGEEVQYSIKVFNEGEVKAKASKITDYIPAGLKLAENSPVKYNHNGTITVLQAQENPEFGYKYDEANNVLSIALKGNDENTDFISEFNGTNLSYDEIIVTCKVVEGATGILTNVAEISEYQTPYGIINNDVDSTKDNWQAEGDENKLTNTKDSDTWRNYSNGKSENANDAEWHPDFIAQDRGLNNNYGDDDDFDKLIVKKDYKLTLKKINQDTNQTTDDIQFEVTRNSSLKEQGEDLGTISTQNGIKEFKETINNNAEGTITYTFKEVPNANYVQLKDLLKIDLRIVNGKITSYNFAYANRKYSGVRDSEKVYTFSVQGIELTIKVNVNYNTNEVTVEIGNKQATSSEYGIGIRKVSSGDGRAMTGVTFDVTRRLNGGENETISLEATNSSGDTNILNNIIDLNTVRISDYYEFTETNTLPGYTKLTSPIKVWVNKYTTNNEKFDVQNFTIECENKRMIINDGTKENSFVITQNGVDYEVTASTVNNNGVKTLKITVPNAPSNPVPVEITKVSKEDGTQLKGADIEVRKVLTNTKLQTTTDSLGTILYTDSVDAETTSVSYELKELNAPEGYDNIFYGKTIKLDVTLASGVVSTVTAKVYNGDTEDTDISAEVSATVENGTVKVSISNPKTVKVVDLALRKVIVSVDGKDVDSSMGKYDRLTESDRKVSIRTIMLNLRQGTNAFYYLNKTPILVQRGSKIKYQIRIYNEGEEIDATASKIKDYIPSGLKFENAYYRNEQTPLTEGTDYTLENNTLTINVLNSKNLIAKYDNANDILSSDYVTVECSVKETAKGILTNVAEIAEYKTTEGIVTEDRDSEPANWINPVDGNVNNNGNVNYTENQKWVDYAGKSTNVLEEAVYKNYVGQQDDDDFEKVLVGDVDLVLKKVITNVGETSVDDLEEKYQRFQNGEINVDTSKMNNDTNITTAEYLMNKTPIKVKIGDEVTYQIRIYNEGSINADASQIKDYIPKGLTFKSASYNGNALVEGTDYTLNDQNVLTISAMKGHLIDSYDGVEPKYDYVTVVCTVNGQVRGLLTNVAEISEYETSLGVTTKDRDSQTTGTGEWQAPVNSNKNTLDGKSGESWARYGGDDQNGQFADYPDQQDDDDFEKIIVTTGYTLKVLKVSNNTGSGIDGAEFKVNDEDLVTDENGYTQTLGLFEMNLTQNLLGKLDMYTIKEVSTKEGYSKIGIRRNPNAPEEIMDEFYVFIRQELRNDGSIEITGGYVNFLAPRVEGAFEFRGNNKTITLYTTDEDGNYIPVQIKIAEDSANIGNYDILVTVGNNIKDSKYDLYIKKVDEDGNNVNGTKFQISSDNMYRPYEYYYTTTEGTINLGEYKISNENVNVDDNFIIEEIETASNLHLLEDKIQLVVSKALTENGYEPTSIKLVAGENETEPGTNVTLEGVKLKGGVGTVNVTAKLENGVVTVTIPNKMKIFDLALRKHVINVNDDEINRWSNPAVDASKLISGESTTATYNNGKNPVEVHIKDTVLYGIKVYNEGEINGFAEVVMDDVPEGLEMIAPGNGEDDTSSINSEYRWKMYRKIKNGEAVDVNDVVTYNNITYVETDNASETEIIRTDYLSKAVGESVMKLYSQVNPNLMKAFDKNTMIEPDSREVRVEFKVKTSNNEGDVIINKAQISEDTDEDGNPVDDIDSTPNVWEDSPRDDDQDIEKLIVVRRKEFDLSLRKFITQVNDKDLENSREPQVDTSKLVSGKATTATYKHPKEDQVVLVNPSDVVTYTIRVYNEGEVDGYANLVMDDIPEGVDFLPESEINKAYGWVMLAEVGNVSDSAVTGGVTEDGIIYNGKKYQVTNDASEAKVIVTDYLAMNNGENNLIKAFNPYENKLDYKDIKVQFKVESVKADKIITNYAQITDDCDNEGNPVDDRDSTPNVWEDTPRNDDQDYDVIKVGYFDLALYKWVSTAIVTEDGKATEYPSKHTQNDKTNMVNVSIPKNKLNKVEVKFKYQIKVENEGTVAGYAKELKDHIPAGLKFVESDNKEFGWTLQEDGTITTDYLKDTLLNPGDTAEVTVVLTWINGETNFGQKINYAEISKDQNEFDWPDIDSTPNNFKDTPKEDDEDSDIVMLQIRTGFENTIYIVIALVATTIIAAGVVGIKKYVLNRE